MGIEQGREGGGGQGIDKEMQHFSVWETLLRGQYGRDEVLTYPNYSPLVTLLAQSLGPSHWGTFSNEG